jgi:integrase
MRTDKRKFTDRYLRSIKPRRSTDPGYGGFLWDAALPHFGVKVTGEIGFYAGLRSPETRKWVEKKLGVYPLMPIEGARQHALPVIAAMRGGLPLPALDVTFADVFEEYVETVLPGKDTAREIEQKLRTEILPHFGARPIASIRHEDIVGVLGSIAGRKARNATGSKIQSGGKHAARKAHAYLGPFFKWSVHERKGGLTSNPMADVTIRLIVGTTGFNRIRDHLIPDDDLRTIWAATETFGYPFGSLVRLLLMCGARLNEAARLTHDEIRGDTIFLRASRTKTEEVHTIPITAHMRALIDTLPDFGPGTFLFSTTGGRRPIAGFSKFKEKFDRAVAHIASVEPWQLHDLRRCCRTGLSRVGVETLHAELCIGHRRQGVERVYDRHSFETQKRAALERWQQLLFTIVEPPAPGAGNVVGFPERVSA